MQGTASCRFGMAGVKGSAPVEYQKGFRILCQPSGQHLCNGDAVGETLIVRTENICC